MNLNKNILLYVIILILLIKFGKDLFINTVPNSSTKIDSILKVFDTKIQTSRYQEKYPQPIINIYPSSNPNKNSDLTNSLISEFNKLKDNDKKLEAYLKVISTKVYRNVYNDSLSKVTMIDTISNGVLKNQSIQIDYKPRKFKLYEKKITEKLKPKLIISAGLGIQSTLNNNANTQLQGIVELTNKKGNSLQFGYSSSREFSLIYKRDLFTKY